MNTKKEDKVINWPANGKYFTHDDVFALNPNNKQISLRMDVNNAIKAGQVSKIGTKNFGKGRPKMILAMTPATKEVLDTAHQDGVQPLDKPQTTIPVINVSSAVNQLNPITDIKPNVIASTETIPV